MTTEEMLVSLVENVKNINSTLNNMNKQTVISKLLQRDILTCQENLIKP